VEILSTTPDALKLIELAGRTCYKSEDKITEGSAKKFVQMIIKRRHFSVLEHASMTARFVVDRGVTHEQVRHRLCAYSQESTRYCNYGGSDVCFIIPPWVDLEEGEYATNIGVAKSLSDRIWMTSMLMAETHYQALLAEGWKPQQARSVLPNSLKTEIVHTANFREWMHIFNLRCAPAAHPQIREVMLTLEDEMAERYPCIFGDE